MNTCCWKNWRAFCPITTKLPTNILSSKLAIVGTQWPMLFEVSRIACVTTRCLSWVRCTSLSTQSHTTGVRSLDARTRQRKILEKTVGRSARTSTVEVTGLPTCTTSSANCSSSGNIASIHLCAWVAQGWQSYATLEPLCNVWVPMYSGSRNLTRKCTSKVFLRVFKAFMLISKFVPAS